MNNDYRHLRADKLLETADRVASRIVGRFPQASLGKVAATIADLTRNAIDRAEAINRPNWWIRGALIVLGIIVILAAAAGFTELSREGPFLRRLFEYMRLTQGAAVYLGAFLVFFWTLETRYKRGKAVQAIHQLRGLAHIIDMHQLSKDPDCGPQDGDDTYTPQGMAEYLGYCTELLAIVSKIGQLYVQDFPDGTTLAAVDQFENLATGLSQKIWQKIMIFERTHGLQPPPQQQQQQQSEESSPSR